MTNIFKLLLMAVGTIVIALIIIFPTMGTLYNSRCSSQYDYQHSETFLGNFSSLSYNVYVLNQSDFFGKGPAYLLNGLTNKGYWYQVGIGYNWSKYGTVHGTGFSTITYLEFVTTTNATPAENVIFSGDKILLSMSFANGNVILKVHDWNTNFTNETYFPSYNATYFVGGPYKNGTNNGTSDKSGHFTGLMTEWWHPDIYANVEAPIVYSPYLTTYNSVQLLVHDVGIIPQPTANNFNGALVAFTCSVDAYNLVKNAFNQTSTSGIIEINNSTAYNFSPFTNVTLQLRGRTFITK